MVSLSQEKALIFRITHIDNVPWILDNGLHCCNSTQKDPSFRNIGNIDLIRRRTTWPIAHPLGGTLADYVPFYFTPHSPMLYNISTGYNVPRTPMQDIAIFVSSLHEVMKRGLKFLFSDRHAYTAAAQFSSDLADLDRLPWTQLQNRDFKRDLNDLGKTERYQAEALIHRMMPVDALLGIPVTEIPNTRVLPMRLSSVPSHCIYSRDQAGIFDGPI